MHPATEADVMLAIYLNQPLGPCDHCGTDLSRVVAVISTKRRLCASCDSALHPTDTTEPDLDQLEHELRDRELEDREQGIAFDTLPR